MGPKPIPESGKSLAKIDRSEAPSLGAMTRPPEDAKERDSIGQQIWMGVVLRFEHSLSESDLSLWQKPPTKVADSPEHLRLLRSFDNFLLDLFADWGWRMLMSVAVLHRISEWEKHSPHLLERLGRQLALRSRVLRGEKSSPFEQDMVELADKLTEELDRLLRLCREENRNRRLSISCQEIAEWMDATIRKRPLEFEVLRGNRAQLYGFVHMLPLREKAAAEALRRGDLRAKAFFLLWYARTHNRSLKDVKNEFSKRRSERRQSPGTVPNPTP